MPMTKTAAPKRAAATKAPAAKKAAAAATNSAPAARPGARIRVSKGTAPGGYTVYGSALKTKHRTAAQIAAAIAALD